MYSRRMKSSHLDTVAYEIDMLRFSFRRLEQATPQWDDGDRYIYIEAFLLHYRNLLSFFSGNNHQRDDLSMKTPSDWADRDVSEIEALSYKQRAMPLETSYFRDICKYLQHCTKKRLVFQQWPISDMFGGIEPIMAAFEKDFLNRPHIGATHGHVANSTASVSQPLVRLSSLPRLDKP
jgi:hypothetical protein